MKRLAGERVDLGLEQAEHEKPVGHHGAGQAAGSSGRMVTA